MHICIGGGKRIHLFLGIFILVYLLVSWLAVMKQWNILIYFRFYLERMSLLGFLKYACTLTSWIPRYRMWVLSSPNWNGTSLTLSLSHTLTHKHTVSRAKTLMDFKDFPSTELPELPPTPRCYCVCVCLCEAWQFVGIIWSRSGTESHCCRVP